jgi:hypothetical protein
VSVDLWRIIATALEDLNDPINIEDNTYRSRRVSHDPIAMMAGFPPAYCVNVVVNGWGREYLGPWVAVHFTERFGFPPIGPMEDVYTYLYPSDDLDSEDPAAVKAWFIPALQAAVAKHAPGAAAARLADADVTGPIEARDAIRRIG